MPLTGTRFEAMTALAEVPMNHVVFTVALIGVFVQPAQAQNFDFLKRIFGQTGADPATEDKQSGKPADIAPVLTQADAETGLKEVLTMSARLVATQLSAENGYFGDDAIRIPLPGQIGNLQRNLSRIGLSGPLDDLQLRVNRAAEAAAPEAVDLVIGAVEQMTVEDAISIVRGGDTAATDYLRLKVGADLEMMLRPHLETALTDAGALKLVDDLAGKYDLEKLNIDPRKDIVDHSVAKALDGLFFYLAEEEQDIRSNPVQRTTDILRKVFGG